MFHFLGNRKIDRTSNSYITSNYYLYDKFTTELAAGAVNGTQAEPVGGARVIVDNGFISVTGGVLSWATGGLQNNGVFYPAQTRALGKEFISTVTTASSYALRYGFHTGQSGAISDGIQTGTTCYAVIGGALTAIHGDLPTGAYQYAIVQRASGMFIFLKGGVFTNWTLMYTTLTTSTATMYPSLITRTSTAVFTSDNMRVPKRFYIPAPLQSDGMSAATTDGLGNPENNGTVGNAYTDVGTWGVSAGVRSCSVLGGGSTGISVLSTNTRNVFIEANLTRSAGRVGIVARYQNSSNYIHCSHDGTNVLVIQVVAGTPTTLSTTAVAYSAGATMKFMADGTTYRAFYNNTAAGSGTLPDTSNTSHGLITNDTGNTFDNLVIWARGNSETQYAWLDTV